MYEYGEGVTKDYATALREFKPLAEEGKADAQNILGVMYQKGWVMC
ncbi:hypothetical protein N9F34_04865 [Alphaproteobacteria bacterium]|nr:hypothetical protein [Alphaproteobacteria bacterium]